MREKILTNFADLKSEKLDTSTYAPLPLKEDALVIEEPLEDDRKKKVLYAQWRKLNIIRKNLKILDGYINNNKKETLIDWLNANNTHVNDIIFNKIGKFNNETGGISAYFLNLQNFYDEQEAVYDGMESKSRIQKEDKERLDKLRIERIDKRGKRRQFRKALLKDLKANNKGYLSVDIEEEPHSEKEKEMAADGKTEDLKKDGDEVVKAIEKTKNNTGKIIVTIAGIALAVTVIYAITAKKST